MTKIAIAKIIYVDLLLIAIFLVSTNQKVIAAPSTVWLQIPQRVPETSESISTFDDLRGVSTSYKSSTLHTVGDALSLSVHHAKNLHMGYVDDYVDQAPKITKTERLSLRVPSDEGLRSKSTQERRKPIASFEKHQDQSSKGEASPGLNVAPSRIVLDGLTPGETRNVAVSVTASGETPDLIKFRVSVADFNLNEDAELKLYPPYTSSKSACDMLLVTPSSAVASVGQPSVVRLSVRVPLNAEPVEKRCMLLFTTENDSSLDNEVPRLQIHWRVGVALYIRVGDPPSGRELVREKTKIELLNDRLARATITIRNTGKRTLRPIMTTSVFDQSGNRTWIQTNEQLPILPEQTRAFVVEAPIEELVSMIRVSISFDSALPIELSFKAPFVKSNQTEAFPKKQDGVPKQ